MSDFTSFSPRLWSNRESGSFRGSVSLSNSFVLGPPVTDGSDETAWLDVTASEVTKERAKMVSGDTNLEQATEVRR